MPGNMNGWLEEDDDMNKNVNNEDIEDEDVEIETPNAESSNSESEDKETYEAELSTNQTEIALLKSKDKIGEKEREISGENATLKKRLDETETRLAWARMERDIAERSLHESQVWNKRFYLDMVRIGAVPKPPSDEEDTERPRKKSKKSSSDGTEGPSEPRGPPSDS
ncbi:hypothetical protein Tco_1503020 [Tanacetum coccineum]